MSYKHDISHAGVIITPRHLPPAHYDVNSDFNSFSIVVSIDFEDVDLIQGTRMLDEHLR